MRHLLIGFLTFVAVGVLFTPAQATDVVLQCGDTVGPGGRYTLTAPVGPCAAAGITVDSATLDMTAGPVTCSGRTFSGVTVIGNGAVVRNGIVADCLNGFEVRGSGHKLKGNAANGNINNGFEVLSADTKLINNEARANGAEGFHVVENTNALKRNNAANNSHNGFDIESGGNSLKRNLVTGNGGHGIIIHDGFSGNTVSKNSATGNTAEDLFDESGSCASNTWSHNTFVTKNPNCIK